MIDVCGRPAAGAGPAPVIGVRADWLLRAYRRRPALAHVEPRRDRAAA